MDITGTSAAAIFDSVRVLTQQGHLPPGTTLPPVRELASRLQVNRNTVALAYRRLALAGIAMTQGRHGTIICGPPSAGEQEGRAGQDVSQVDLADGNPDPARLPDPLAVLGGRRLATGLYGDATITPAMLAQAQAWLQPDCPDGGRIVLTHGAVDAIERLAAAHLVAGDSVAVEDPCFLGTINALRLAGMQTHGIAVDGEGMLPEALARALADGVQAVLLTPRAHNPTGCSLSPARAQALRNVLARHPQVLVILDDHYALLAQSPYVSALPASATRWALVRSVSKGLGPDLRLACVACDPDTADRLSARLAPGMNWVSHILQEIVAASLASPRIRAGLQQAGTAYAQRGAMLATALQARGIASAPAVDGLNLWIPLAGAAEPVAAALQRRGWLVRQGQAFGVQHAVAALRVTVARLEPDTVPRFADDLLASMASD